MTSTGPLPTTGPLTAAETTLLGEWSASLGPIRASFRVSWNGVAAFAGIVRTGVTLVRADDSGADGFPRGRFAVRPVSDTVRVIGPAGAVPGDTAHAQTIEFEDARAAGEFDRGWAATVGPPSPTSPEAGLSRWVAFLDDLCEVVIGLAVLVAIAGIIGSLVLFTHTGPVIDAQGDVHRSHDLVGYGVAGLLGTAVTTALLVAAGAIGKVVALGRRADDATRQAAE